MDKETKEPQPSQVSNWEIDINEVIIRLTKYLLEGIVVAFVAFVLPSKEQMPIENIISLGLIASMTFSIMDVISPSIGATARAGSGFSIGANLVGGMGSIAPTGILGMPFGK